MSRRWLVSAVVAGAAVLALGGCSSARHEAPAVVTEVHVVTETSSAVSSAPVASETPQATTVTETQPQPEPVPAGPVIGARCIGADAGKTAVDPNGVAIICDEYQWRENVGQTPGHSWADEQTKWVECLKVHTTEECRAMLNP